LFYPHGQRKSGLDAAGSGVLQEPEDNHHGLGAEALVVEAKSAERAEEISHQLSQLGFKAVSDENDAYAGMLTLSRKQ
jgi:hypothetical protein